MPFSPMLSGLSDLLQNVAEAFAVDPQEVILVNVFILSFLILLILPSLVHAMIIYTRQKALAEKTYTSVTKDLNLTPEELRILEKLVRYTHGGVKDKHLLVLKANVFNNAVKRLSGREEIPAALLASLRLKLGFVFWSKEGAVHSTAELPKGLRLYILPKDGSEFYAKIIHQTPFNLLVKKEDPDRDLPTQMAWVLVFFERTNGIFSFSTLVKKVENGSIIHLAHSEKIIQNQHRRYYRRKIVLPVKVRQQGLKQPVKQSTITDLGGGGLSLINPEGSFKLNDRLVLNFLLPADKQVTLTGKVIRLSHYRRNIHLVFEPMNERVRDNIIGYILNARR